MIKNNVPKNKVIKAIAYKFKLPYIDAEKIVDGINEI